MSNYLQEGATDEQYSTGSIESDPDNDLGSESIDLGPVDVAELAAACLRSPKFVKDLSEAMAK